MLVPAQHEVDPGHGADELGVLLERKMRERDDRVGRAAKLLHLRLRGLDGVAVAHPVLLGRIDRHADEADPDGPSVHRHRNDRRRRHARERLSARVGDVRGDDPELSPARCARGTRLPTRRTRGCRASPSRPRWRSGRRPSVALPAAARPRWRSRAPTATGSRPPASSAAATGVAFSCWITVATRARPPDFPPSTGRIS